jgi:uncharacterized protein (TIGR03790 family)
MSPSPSCRLATLLVVVMAAASCGDSTPGAADSGSTDGNSDTAPELADSNSDTAPELADSAPDADAADAPQDIPDADGDDLRDIETDTGPDLADAADTTPPPARTELLVVYAAGNAESEALAAYYADPVTGRDIDPELLLGLEVPDTSTIDRATFESAIRSPIASWIQSSGRRFEIKYLLLIKGIPHRIQGAAEFEPAASTFSSVDSELCVLFSAGLYPIEGWLFNGPNYNDYTGGGGFYLETDNTFRHQRFNVSSRNRRFTLDYLVGRLDAYTFEDARALVDRSLAADSEGAWVVLDTSPGRRPLDSMVDPVWPRTDDTGDSADERLRAAGLQVVTDTTDLTLTGAPGDDLPPGAVDAVIAYAGWGVNHGGPGYDNGALYIQEDLRFTWQPGAAWISYESFNGTVLDGAVYADNPGARRGQGQIGDFLARGGTVAIGNAWEPFASAVGHEAHIFERYLVHGDPWIEAAYKGLRYLSWQEIVVGDPLCQVRP